MQSHADAGMPPERFDERQIATLVDCLEHGIEIADGLMSVDEQNEMELGHVALPSGHVWHDIIL
jgi:hypothetical protein